MEGSDLLIHNAKACKTGEDANIELVLMFESQAVCKDSGILTAPQAPGSLRVLRLGCDLACNEQRESSIFGIFPRSVTMSCHGRRRLIRSYYVC